MNTHIPVFTGLRIVVCDKYTDLNVTMYFYLKLPQTASSGQFEILRSLIQ